MERFYAAFLSRFIDPSVPAPAAVEKPLNANGVRSAPARSTVRRRSAPLNLAQRAAVRRP